MAKRQTAVAARMDKKAAAHDKSADTARSLKRGMTAGAAGAALLPGAGVGLSAGLISGAAVARKGEKEARGQARDTRNRAAAIDYLAKRKTSPQTKAAESSRAARSDKPAEPAKAGGRTRAFIDKLGRNYANGRAIKAQ